MAKEFVKDFMPVGTVVTLRTYKDKGGKYGRYMGDFKRHDKWLCEELIKNYMAVPYFGQSKRINTRSTPSQQTASGIRFATTI